MAIKKLILINRIKKSECVNITSEDGESYTFKMYPFGELGSWISFELMKEIVSGMEELLLSVPKFDYIIAPEPGGHLWGWF